MAAGGSSSSLTWSWQLPAPSPGSGWCEPLTFTSPAHAPRVSFRGLLPSSAVPALALYFHDKSLWYVDPQFRWYAVPSIWVTVLALVVPACAAVLVPRQFGVALLAGWIAGGADLFGVLYLWDRYQANGAFSTTAIITFGFTLLALVVVTVFFARAVPGSEAGRAV